MSTEIGIYESPGFGSIRTVVIEGKTWFVAVDIARNLAYRTAAELTRLLPDDEKGYSTLSTPGGEQKVSVLSEAGVYRACVTRTTAYIKDTATRERVEAFQRWVLHEVLPKLRESGFYLNAAPSQLDDASFEQLMSYALAAANARVVRLQAENEAMRPKVELADAMLGSKDTILVRELAQLLTQAGYSIGANQLFERLRNEGYLIKAKAHDENQPTRKAIRLGLFEVRECPVVIGGVTCIKRTPRVTPKGQAYFLERYAGARALPEVPHGE